MYNTEVKKLNNTGNPFYSPLTLTGPGTNDPLFIIGNGIADNARSTAFLVTQDGRSMVTKNNGNNTTAIIGSTCKDNIVNAWGHATFNKNTVTASYSANYGVSNSILRTGVGTYTILTSLTDNNGSTVNLSDIAVTVTMCDDGNESTVCTIPLVKVHSPVDVKFDVKIYKVDGTTLADHSFMFHVTGR
jgi:hypothetical protein